MPSDPAIREGLVENLRQAGGSVYGRTFGAAVRKILPAGVSMSKGKRAMNSLAHTTARPRQATIRRTGGIYGISDSYGGYHITQL